jgi:uncharacterized membrane protein
MPLYYFSVGLAILSNIVYHLCQKLTPGDANPALALTVTYVVSAVGCLALLLTFYPLKTSLGQALRKLNWASLALGISLVGLELGFLLAYRAGWNISLVANVVNTFVALSLIPIGLVFFKEKLSLVNAAGIVLCLLGLIMINLKK